MIITPDVYSGRQNPSWRLSAKDASRFMERVADRAVPAAGDDELPSNLPQAFRVGDGPVEGYSFASATKPLSESEAGEACNRGTDTIFCGYRYSPTGMHVS